MNQYLYAIVDRMPPAWRPPTTGLGEASVVPRRIHDVVVLGSLLDVVPPATPRTLSVHHDIVATLMDAGALLPFRYGTTVPAGALDDWVGAHRALLTAALGAVRDCVEMTVKLLRLDASLASGRERGRGAAGPMDGQLQALADALVERAGLSEWRRQPGGTNGNVADGIAFLVPRPEVPTFLARIAPVASHAVGVAVVPTGPWPPYSFVPDFQRAPLGRVAPSRRDAPDRRVG